MTSEGIKKNQSIGKAFAILETMAEESKSIRLMDLSQKLGIPSSTCIRFLNSLIDFGYVKQEPDTSRYYLTLKLSSLGSKVYNRFSYQNVMRKYLHRVSDILQESVSLSIEQDMNVVYIDAVDGPDHMLQTLQRIGKIAPMHSTGAGKVLLLNYNDKELERFIDIKGLPGFTSKTLVTRISFLKAMEKVRRTGFAYDDEECEIGVKCIAYPIWDFTNKVVAAISVSAPISRMDEQRQEEIQEVLSDISAEASRELGKVQAEAV